MTNKLKKQIPAITGLSLGLLATLTGIYMSSAIEATPALIGIVSSVWISVSAAILGNKFSHPAT